MWSVHRVRRRAEFMTGLGVYIKPRRGWSTLYWGFRDGLYWPSHIVWDPPGAWLADAAAIARLSHEIGHMMLYRNLPPILVDAKTAIASGSSLTPECREAVLEDERAAWEAGRLIATIFSVPQSAYEAEHLRSLRTYEVTVEKTVDTGQATT